MDTNVQGEDLYLINLGDAVVETKQVCYYPAYPDNEYGFGIVRG